MESKETSPLARYEQLSTAIEECLDEIERQAQMIIDDRWRQVLHYEKQNPGWENRSRLGLRCYRKGRSIQLEWSGITWKKQQGGKPLRLRVHIRKGAGHSYPMMKLQPFMAAWEESLVHETEEKLAPFRVEVYHLNRALISLRYAQKVVKDMESISG